MIVAVIPARGGSKRIPRKNIREFAGKPVIAYSIEAARESGLFDRVIVSTDDAEIAAVAKRYGAEVPFLRPATLADDFSGTGAVVRHSVQWMQENGIGVSCVCCIYATAPFVQPAFLREGYEKLLATGKSYAFSVTSFPFPIQRALRMTRQAGVEPFFPEYRDARSQDLEEGYHDAGQFYWGQPDAFLNDVPIFSQASVPVVIPRHLVQDIDTPEDWLRAEFMFKAWHLSMDSDV